MKKSIAFVGAAALALALTTSLGMAQPGKGPPTSPPANSQAHQPSGPPITPATPASPATPATPATPADPGESSATPASPATPAVPATPASPAAAQNESAPQGCRTRKPAGDPCACLSDTSRVGMSTAHPNGHNVCVRPE